MTTLTNSSLLRRDGRSRRGARSTDGRPHTHFINRGLRIVVAVALSAAAVWLVLNAGLVREIEAHLAAFWMNGIVDRGVTAFDDVYVLWIAENHMVGFEVTAECTVVVLLAPLLVLSAGMIMTRRVRWLRGLAGIAAMVILVTTVNQLRLALIGWATQQWGLEAGYEISHRFVGSAIGIVGFAAGLVALILVMGLRRKKNRSPQA